MMVDLDCFKAYNDSFGHLAGDMCLQMAAAVLTEHLKRPADLAVRYGGEEFAIVLPETGLEGALAVTEACRSHFAGLAIDNPNAAHGKIVTMSIGVASEVPSKNGSVEQLIERADKALYAAKADGRNRVCQAPDPSPDQMKTGSGSSSTP
jgi:two-component system chemotaxis family response regulator WspR